MVIVFALPLKTLSSPAWVRFGNFDCHFLMLGKSTTKFSDHGQVIGRLQMQNLTPTMEDAYRILPKPAQSHIFQHDPAPGPQ
jgi:hypothetical protein